VEEEAGDSSTCCRILNNCCIPTIPISSIIIHNTYSEKAEEEEEV